MSIGMFSPRPHKSRPDNSENCLTEEERQKVDDALGEGVTVHAEITSQCGNVCVKSLLDSEQGSDSWKVTCPLVSVVEGGRIGLFCKNRRHCRMATDTDMDLRSIMGDILQVYRNGAALIEEGGDVRDVREVLDTALQRDDLGVDPNASPRPVE